MPTLKSSAAAKKPLFTFPVVKLAAGTNYKFFCSFSGHAGVMNGGETGRLNADSLPKQAKGYLKV